MTLSKCAICDSKKRKFVKNQVAKGLLSNWSIRTPLSKTPILGDLFFKKMQLSPTPLNKD